MMNEVNSPAVLDLHHVSISYDRKVVVTNVDLQLEKGQIACLLGPSGCGKSTLLRAIAGFEPLHQGHIDMLGEQIADNIDMIAPEKRDVGMVFQDIALFPHLSCEKNIAFGIKKWPKAERKARVAELLKLVGLENVAQRYPHSLSGGQQQRIALARALAPRPTLLLLDEPFSGLDAKLGEELVPQVREILKAEGISALMVTHNQYEAFTMADKVAIMHKGKIAQWDTAYNIYHEPATQFVADFIGQGSLIDAIVIDDQNIECVLGKLSCEHNHGFNRGAQVSLLVRPDDVLHNDESQFEGEILSKRFRGSHFVYQIELKNGEYVYSIAPSHHDHHIGDSLGIYVEIDHLVMFPRSI
jgi:iron(III) transport system ATP-binding protein